MARSHYIYLIRWDEPGHPSHKQLLAAFTVKHEANQWAKMTPHPFERMKLKRMRDGMTYDKSETTIPWDDDELRKTSRQKRPEPSRDF